MTRLPQGWPLPLRDAQWVAFRHSGAAKAAATHGGFNRLDRRSVPRFHESNGASVAGSFVILHLLLLGASDANDTSVANGAPDHLTYLPQRPPTARGAILRVGARGQARRGLPIPHHGYGGYCASPRRIVQFSRARLTTKHGGSTCGAHADISDVRATWRRSRIASSLPRSSGPHPLLG